jgi:hypothetical protein
MSARGVSDNRQGLLLRSVDIWVMWVRPFRAQEERGVGGVHGWLEWRWEDQIGGSKSVSAGCKADGQATRRRRIRIEHGNNRDEGRIIFHESEPMDPRLVTNLHDSAHGLGRRNHRGSTALRGVTTAGRQRGIAAPQTFGIGLTGKNGGEDGGDDDKEGQGEGRESAHSGKMNGMQRGSLCGARFHALRLSTSFVTPAEKHTSRAEALQPRTSNACALTLARFGGLHVFRSADASHIGQGL